MLLSLSNSLAIKTLKTLSSNILAEVGSLSLICRIALGYLRSLQVFFFSLFKKFKNIIQYQGSQTVHRITSLSCIDL